MAWGESPLPPIASLPARSLFAYLITYRERPHTRDLLAGTFWPDLPDAQARRRLSQALWQIGRVLQLLPNPTPYLLANAETVQFNTAAAYWLDVEEFEGLVAKYASRQGDDTHVQPALSTSHLSTCLPDLRTAITLYRGDLLAGFYDDWLVIERERLRELYLASLGRLLALNKHEGAYEDALGYAHRLIAEDPLNEEGHREVMRLCCLLGRRHEAQQQYERCRAILAAELGVEPSAATTALWREIAAEDEAAQPPYLPQPAAARPAPLLERGGQTPLVGRTAERSALVGRLEGAGGGRGGLVLIEGEAGIGKTRLLDEVARDAGWRGVQVLRGHGQEFADAAPYGPLAAALRAGLSSLRAGQLAQLVEEAWLGEASLLLPELAGRLPGAAGESAPQGRPASTVLESGQARDRLQEALGRVVLALGQIAPHLLILEDLHWADEDTFSALNHLAPRLRDSRVLVLASYRSGEARARPATWEALQALDRSGCCERLELAPLTAEETGELVRRGLGLAQPVPYFASRLHRETAGNPLFLLETLRALYDEGVLYRDRAGAWSTPWDEVTTDYAELPLPASVRQVIARRLARLGPEERATLNAAAVLGAEFDLALLLHASGQERGVSVATAGELVRGRLLDEQPATYRFSHDQVRRAVYAEIPEGERRRLHRRAGEALAARQPQPVGALAYHFSQAQETNKALRYNAQAGDQARMVYASTEAIRYYDRALAAWGRLQPPDQASGFKLYHTRGEIYQETGRFSQAQADLAAAHALAVQIGDPLAQATALNSLSYLCFQRGEYHQAAEIARQALGLSQPAAAPRQMADALLNRANALRNLGNPGRAIELYDQAAALFDELDQRNRLADCLCRMGYAYLFQGRYTEAQHVIERSLVVRRQLGDKVGTSYSLTNLTALHYLRGEFDRAREVAQEAFAISGASNDPYGQDAALFNIGLTSLEQGDPERAMALFEQALALARQISDRPLVAEALAELGRAHADLGHLARAQKNLEEALSALATGGECWHRPRAHAYLARVLLATGACDQALAQAHRGLEAAQRLTDPWTLGLIHRVAAEVIAHCDGDADLIKHHFAESILRLRKIGANAELARTLAAYGRHLLGLPEASEAEQGAAYVAEARALFQQLAMAADLAGLERGMMPRAQPGRIMVRLPRAGVPTGRPLREDERVEVVWTVAAAEDEVLGDKARRRQGRLLRLLRQAEDQEAAPTVADLAAALHVSRATIKRDLAELRAGGQEVRTRGSQAHTTNLRSAIRNPQSQ